MKHLLLLFLFVPFAAGQMGTGYSTYSNYTADGNGNIYVNAVVDGAASCPQQIEHINCATVRHYGVVSITLNGVTTTTTGNQVSPSSYISVGTTGTITGVVDGVDYVVNGTAQVQCTAVGVVFQESPGLLGTIGKRFSAFVYSGNKGNNQCLWMSTCRSSVCNVSEWTGKCYGANPFYQYLQCYDVIYTPTCGCTGGGKPECVYPHAVCRLKQTPGQCS